MIRRGWVLAAVLGATLPTLVGAWGPVTHQIFNHSALEALRDIPALATESGAEVFTRSGACGDLALDLTRGGKVDPSLNRRLHDEAFLDRLLARARQRGEPREIAFALGLIGHLAGDRAGNPRGGPLDRDPFDFSPSHDLHGQPVQDPAASATSRLRPTVMSLNKLMISATLWDSRPDQHGLEPWVETELLAAAFAAEPAGADDWTPPDAGRLRGIGRRFARSHLVLRQLARNLGNSRRFRGPFEQHWDGLEPGGRGVDGSIEAVVQAVRSAWEGRRAPSAPGPSEAAPEPSPPGLSDQDFADLTSAFAEAVAAGLGEDAPVAEGLPAAPGDEAGAEADSEDPLPGLSRKLYMTYLANALLPLRSWGTLQRRVRDVVPRPAEEEQPGRIQRGLDRLGSIWDDLRDR